MMIKYLFLLFLVMTTTGFTMEPNSKIYVAGHTGLVGSALIRLLQKEGYTNILVRTSSELDLRSQKDVEDFFAKEQPEYALIAAAKVGGIGANMDYPAEFLYDNLMITGNVLHAAYKFGVKKLLFLGSSCIYPRDCEQPIKEEYLLNGYLEKTNEPYAIAKIAGLKLCEAYNRQYGTKFISCMPTNLYGPEDNFDPETSHVLPGLIGKFSDAKEKNTPIVRLWGTGTAKREFLYVDDLAEALLFLMNHYEEDTHINIGTGEDLSIAELASTIKEIVGYTGTIEYDVSKPDGTPRKLLNVDRLHKLGWKAKTDLKEGIRLTYDFYLKKYPEK